MNGTDIAGEEPHMASQSDDSDKTKGVVVEKEESGQRRTTYYRTTDGAG